MVPPWLRIVPRFASTHGGGNDGFGGGDRTGRRPFLRHPHQFPQGRSLWVR